MTERTFAVNHNICLAYTHRNDGKDTLQVHAAQQMLETMYSYADVKPTDWQTLADRFDQASRSINSSPKLKYGNEGKFIRAELWFELPQVEVLDRVYDELRINLFAVKYYGVELTDLPSEDGACRVYLPDTMDPNDFIVGEKVFQLTQGNLGYYNLSFPLDGRVLGAGARFWLSTLLPFWHNRVADQAVAFFTFRVQLVEHLVLGSHYVPPPSESPDWELVSDAGVP